MEEQGLAGQSQVGQDAQMAQMVQQVMEMLMQGAKPEELIAQGIPASVIEMAVKMLREQQAQQVPMQQDPGLAQRMIQG